MGETTTDRHPVAIGVLGPLEVRRDGGRVALGRPQQRAVLARLAVAVGQVVTTDRLVEAVWGEHPTPGATTTLQTHVFHLRQVLEPERARGTAATVLVTRGNGYLLDLAEDAVDAHRFERLLQDALDALDALDAAGRRADVALRLIDEGLALWRGEVLADLADYAFITPYAARLEGLRVTALEARIRALLDLGQEARALAEADSLVAAHPLREGAHEQRIVALYRAGRQADALAAYREVWTLLDEELGIEPGPGLQTLQARMLAHDPSLLAPRPGTATAGARARPTPETSVADEHPVVPSASASTAPEGAARRTPRLQWLTRPVRLLAAAACAAALGASRIMVSGSIGMEDRPGMS